MHWRAPIGDLVGADALLLLLLVALSVWVSQSQGERQGYQPPDRYTRRMKGWMGFPDTTAFAQLCDLLSCYLGPRPRTGNGLRSGMQTTRGLFSKLGSRDSPMGEPYFLETGLSCAEL